MALPNYSEFEKSNKTAYWDDAIESKIEYRPQFISNEPGNTMQAFLDRSLADCDEFIISVAFITRGGLAPLMQTLLDLEKHGVKGKILTTDYLTFTEPEALKSLLKLSNIKLKMFCCNSSTKGFHTKGYIFKKDEIISISIGSSNLTQGAIVSNKEWNTSFSTSGNGEIYKHIINDFNALWESEYAIEVNEENLSNYSTLYKENKRLEKEKARILSESKIVSVEQIKLSPNSMQIAFINKLNDMRNNGAKRALLISATGTGKTYAAAFALRDINPKRALFLVHREIILKQAQKTFKNVFGTTKTFGLYSGNVNESDRDFVFATMQTMAKHYEDFKNDAFDVIVIDEAHRSGANSYQVLLDYFKPTFWLGMTASPDRADGFDVYKTFDYNIAHEIRLQEAMKLNLLCPFHYYGITDFLVDGKNLDFEDFSNLVCDERVNSIIEKAEYFGHSGKRLKGLVFCSRTEEAEELSKKFNQRGYRTVALHSEMNAKKLNVAKIEDAKEVAIEKLESDDYDNGLDYIFTVDMFNEGVDIPQVNQVIMLRRTESPIVFIQQLGRGLRKADDKEYVMILDFIGNYDNNYMIPVALSGDRTYNKDNIRRYVREGHKVLEGASSIHFDEIARDKIFKSIDTISNIGTIIKSGYQSLKCRLGRVPSLFDFYENGNIDPLLILERNKNYYDFLLKMESSPFGEENLNDQEVAFLNYLSIILPKGTFIGGSRILYDILNNGFAINGNHISQSTISILQGSFLKKTFKIKNSDEIDIEKTEQYPLNHVEMIECADGKITANPKFVKSLDNDIFKKQVQDLIDISLCRFDSIYKKNISTENPFALYEKYSRQDVCLLLNADKDLSSTMYGKWRQNDHVCIFVTYHKAEAGEEKEYVDGKPNYADEFIDAETFLWDTQMGQDENSPYMDSVESATHKHLFVKKSDGEGFDFYYMGEFRVVNKKHATKKDNKGKERPIAKVTFTMNTPVKQDMLNYLKAN